MPSIWRETLVQDAFFKLWDNRDSIETPKHIFFFLRMVMKRQCFTFYTTPKNQFFRKINSLESYENYQDYLAGYDPVKDSESLQHHERDQNAFDRITKILPLLNPETKHLVELCLKYGFQYKAISIVMGKSITETSNEVKAAITDIKTIINHGSKVEANKATIPAIKVEGVMTADQARILELRCKEKHPLQLLPQYLTCHKRKYTASLWPHISLCRRNTYSNYKRLRNGKAHPKTHPKNPAVGRPAYNRGKEGSTG